MTETNSQQLIEQARMQVRQARNKQAEFTELLAKLDNAKQEIAALQATATSPDGSVTVTAGAGGIVQSVDLSTNAMSNNAASLSSSINAAIAQAISQVTSQQTELVHRHVGQDVDETHVLGPQAVFATAGTADTTTTASSAHTDHSTDHRHDVDVFTDPLARNTSTEPHATPTAATNSSTPDGQDDDDPFGNPLNLR